MSRRYVAALAIAFALTGCVAAGPQAAKRPPASPHGGSSKSPAPKLPNGVRVSLPRAGFAVSRGHSVVLYTMSGRQFRVLSHVRIANTGYDRHPWLKDSKGRYLRLRGGRTVFRAMKTPQGPIESDGKACIVTTSSRHSSVEVCAKSGGGNFRTRLTVTRGSHKLTVARFPPQLPGGNWEYGVLSPDGQQVLAQWSGECEVPQPYLVDTSTGQIRPIGSLRSVDAPEGFALGWTSAGLPVVDYFAGGCGSAVKSAGVYLTSTSGRVGHELIATGGKVVMWS
jgi:hypothetical protein